MLKPQNAQFPFKSVNPLFIYCFHNYFFKNRDTHLLSMLKFFFLISFDQVNSLGIGTPWAGYNAWRVGDTKLDWFGAQKGQESFNGNPASGTPMAWTTNNPAKPEYQPLNK